MFVSCKAAAAFLPQFEWDQGPYKLTSTVPQGAREVGFFIYPAAEAPEALPAENSRQQKEGTA